MGKIALTTMFVGSALAAISGTLMGSVLMIGPFMGGEALWRAFIIIIVGGIGSLSGTVVAAFFVSDVALASAAHAASTAALRAGGRRRTPLVVATDILTAV